MTTAIAIAVSAFAIIGCHGGHGASPVQAPEATSPDASHEARAAPLTEVGIAVPIAPGKTQAWQAALEELLGPRYDEYASSRMRYGLTSQTTFLQRTPMGDFALIHLTGPDVHASFHAMSNSQDPWDIKWRELTLNLHGMDFAKGERVFPKVEPAFSTGPGDAPGPKQFMFLAPLSPEGAARFRALSVELMGPRHDAYVHARARLGIRREAAYLESTAMGDAAVFYWTADDPVASLQRLAASTDPFDVWLRTQAGGAHPISLDMLISIASRNAQIAQYPHPRG